MACGVVIGKFYPPHRGHHFLINSALEQVDGLTVIVCDHPAQRIQASLRAEWLQEVHPKAKVVVTPDDLPDEPEPWAKRTIEILGKAPDFVFTSEDYGDNYAKCMGSTHVCVDRDRIAVPISATKIRSNIFGHWDFLSKPVRGHFALRVILIGVESTGKSTLAEDLASELDTNWVEEYGREYSEVKVTSGEEWETSDFVKIAAEQQSRENRAARRANRVLICDTNAFATGVWHERYMDHRSEEVDQIGDKDRVNLYLLAIPDFPFVQDGTRDGEHIRDWMHERFLARLVESKAPVVTLEGSPERRIRKALDEIEKLLSSARQI